MSLIPLHVCIAVLFVALATWVLFAQPGRTLNRALAALLLLYAASSPVFQLMRESVSGSGEYLMYQRLGTMYEVLTPPLLLLIADHLFLRQPRPWWRTVLIVCVAAFSGIVSLVYIVSGEGDHALISWNAAVYYVLWSLIVFLAGRTASSRDLGLFDRRRAAAVGLAFGFLILHSAGLGLGKWIGKGAPSILEWPTLLLTPAVLTGLLAAGLLMRGLPIAFEGPTRHIARAALILPVLAGMMDTLLPGPVGLGYLGVTAKTNTRFLWLSAFAVLLAAAILRYDLAGPGAPTRQRVTRAAGVVLGLCMAGLALGASLSLFGMDRGGLVIGLAVAATIAIVFTVGIGPLRRLPGSLASQVMLDPYNPDVLRERVRLYGGALGASLDQMGRVREHAEPSLRAMRNQLGLSTRDHELLLAMNAARPNANDLVAYRLGLREDQEDLHPFQQKPLARLRDELEVSDWDHARLLEDVLQYGPHLEEGRLLAGRYRLVRRLGHGAFGDVWLAQDSRMGRQVVLKRLLAAEARDARALRRAQRETRTAGALLHPNIVTVHDVEEIERAPFLVMEYLPGGSIADVLREQGPLTEKEANRIGIEILAALQALHERGIVHRDIKPANILLTEGGQAKLGDFTVARELVSGDTIGPGGARGPVGTFAYMAPEQAKGLAPGPEADQYGLAATLIHVITGKPYLDLDGLSHQEAITRIAQAPPPLPLSNITTGFNQVLERALSKRPEDRYPNAHGMRAALTGLQAAPRAVTRAGKREDSDRRPARRRP